MPVAKACLAVMVAAILASGAGTSAAVENMLLNGDFEEGDAWWLAAARPVAVMEWTIDPEESISGDRSSRCAVQNVGGGGVHDLTLDCQTPIIVEEGATYTVDFWLKAVEDRTLTIDFIMNHDPWSRAWQVEHIPVTTEWTVQHHTWESNLDDGNMIFLFSFSKASNLNPEAVMWIDNVRLYEGEFDEEDLGLQPKSVEARDRLAIRWASLK